MSMYFNTSKWDRWNGGRLNHLVYQWVLEILAFFVLATLIAYPILSWDTIPQEIPAQYSLAGEIDGWNSRDSIYTYPMFGALVFIVLTALEFFPGNWNTLYGVNSGNAHTVYRATENMLILLKIEVLLLFFGLTYHMAAALPLGEWFFPVSILVVILTIGACLFVINRAKKR